MKIGSSQIRSGFRPFGRMLLLLAICLLPFIGANAQDQRPRPTATPTPFEPEIVSRDADLETRVRDLTDRASGQQEGVTRNAEGQIGTQSSPGLELLSKEEQSRLLLYLDVLTKLEQRAESLRGQLIAMIEKQNSVSTKIQQVEYNLRPEVISAVTGLTGSFRPEDLRDQRKAELEIEKANLENLLSQIESSISSLENNLRRADSMVERVRSAFEAVLESALGAIDIP